MQPSTRHLAPAALLATMLLAAGPAAAQEKVLRIAMTAADIPRTLGQPDQGFEGNRFTGIPMYDALSHWDLSKADAASVLIPGLALSWAVDSKDKTKWVFKLRPGVKFHDGSAFNADAVVWNLRKVLDKDAPHFDASQVGVTASRMPTLRTARKIDDLTVEFTTSEPDAFLPLNLTNLFMASPAHWQKKYDATPAATPAPDRVKTAWAAFAADASGTGPFKMARFVPRERLEVVANKAYWDPKRTPKIDRVVMLPMPEANARTAALLSGQVDWIEAPSPDAMGSITQRGHKIYFNQQPHVWPWQLSFAEGSPWLDKRVRHAANLCVDRLGLLKLLGGMMAVPKGTVPLGMAIMPPSSVFRPSRSTHKFAAWRTRLSSHGEPSAKLNCHGQTCGWALLWILKPRCTICGRVSGAGASIQSTWPPSSAAVRAFASGIGSITTRSIFGVRFGSQ